MRSSSENDIKLPNSHRQPTFYTRFLWSRPQVVGMQAKDIYDVYNAMPEGDEITTASIFPCFIHLEMSGRDYSMLQYSVLLFISI